MNPAAQPFDLDAVEKHQQQNAEGQTERAV
jgi:hypothetical protein